MSKAKSGFSVAGKAIGAAVAAAGTAIVGLTKKAVENYANYEQLVGGVETLFGTGGKSIEEYASSVGKTVDAVRSEYNNLVNSQETVLQNAANAYKTAGLSANEYMETVTSFSAALINSVGGDTEKAAELSNMAITDMADNANKMGTSLESLQSAYTGFSRGNFTMLDNLSLGFSGTKEGMQQLLDKAEEISGIKYDISSYADMVDAIHVVQTEMGITGTTAKEAASTISGSVGMMKSSWENLVTGVADDNADFDVLIDNFVDSVATAAENIIPRVETAISGIGQLVEKLAPIIAEKLPQMVSSVLPNIMNAASTLVTGLVDGLVGMLPTIVESGGQLLMSLLQGLVDNAPKIIDGVMAAINAFIDFVTQNLPMIVEMGVKLLIQLAVGIVKAIPQLVAKIPQIIAAIVQGIAAGVVQIQEAGANMIRGVWEGIKNMGAWIKDKVTGFFGGVVDSVKNFLGIHSPSRVFAEIGDFMMKGLDNGIDGGAKNVKKTTENALIGVVGVAKEVSKEISANWDKLTDKQKESLKKAKENYKATLQDIARRQEQFSESVKKFTGLFDAPEKKEKMTGEQMLKNQKSQLSRVKKYARLVRKIWKMKIPAALKQELINMGVDGVDDLQSFVNMDTSDMDAFVSAYKEKSAIADKLAKQQFASEKKTAQLQYMKAEVKIATNKKTDKSLSEIKGLLKQLVVKEGNFYIDGNKLVGYTDKKLGKKANNKRLALTGG